MSEEVGKLEIAIAYLERIANPIAYLETEARRNGETLDGRGAIEFANSGRCLSRIAEEALEILKTK